MDVLEGDDGLVSGVIEKVVGVGCGQGDGVSQLQQFQPEELDIVSLHLEGEVSVLKLHNFLRYLIGLLRNKNLIMLKVLVAENFSRSPVVKIKSIDIQGFKSLCSLISQQL